LSISTAPLRVVHIGKYYPPDLGGIESVTAMLARGAAGAGMPTSVLCFEAQGRGDVVDAGVTVRRVPAITVASQPLSRGYLREAVQLGRAADIVHVHLPNMLAALAVCRLGPGPAVVLHWHSDVVGKGLLAQLTAPLEQAMLRRADRIICTSQAYADASATLQPYAHKVAVVPIGAYEPAVQSAEGAPGRATLPPPIRDYLGDRPLVLAVGRLVPYKGFSVLIEGAARLRIDAAVLIVGVGPLEARLRDQIAVAQSAQRVMLAGRVDGPTLAALMRMASVFCMPSIERSEAFGVALIEAQAHGLAAVATHIPGSGVPWVNLDGESGLNVPPGDSRALAHALDRLLADDALRQRLGLGARARFEALFTGQRSVEETLAVYRALRPGV
jgi:glycosyltransferase involved in cell wall biosynthesis